MLLLNILLYSIDMFAYYYFDLKAPEKDRDFLSEFLFLTFENFCHWIISFVYIKTSLETRMLLNKDTYLKSADETVYVKKFRCYLTTANIFASILIIAISATMFIGTYSDGQSLYVGIANLATLLFELICSVAWVWTLIRLYKDIAHSEKLLPNKRVFFLHGSLLTIYYLI
jgi:hypothetical protein